MEKKRDVTEIRQFKFELPRKKDFLIYETFGKYDHENPHPPFIILHPAYCNDEAIDKEIGDFVIGYEGPKIIMEDESKTPDLTNKLFEWRDAYKAKAKDENIDFNDISIVRTYDGSTIPMESEGEHYRNLARFLYRDFNGRPVMICGLRYDNLKENVRSLRKIEKEIKKVKDGVDSGKHLKLQNYKMWLNKRFSDIENISLQLDQTEPLQHWAQNLENLKAKHGGIELLEAQLELLNNISSKLDDVVYLKSQLEEVTKGRYDKHTQYGKPLELKLPDFMVFDLSK